MKARVCEAFVNLLKTRVDYLKPHLTNIIEFMLYATQDEDPNLALQAGEFWLALSDRSFCRDVLPPFLPRFSIEQDQRCLMNSRLVPVLLRGMVYSETDLLLLGVDEEEDDMIPDRPQV